MIAVSKPSLGLEEREVVERVLERGHLAHPYCSRGDGERCSSVGVCETSGMY